MRKIWGNMLLILCLMLLVGCQKVTEDEIKDIENSNKEITKDREEKSSSIEIDDNTLNENDEKINEQGNIENEGEHANKELMEIMNQDNEGDSQSSEEIKENEEVEEMGVKVIVYKEDRKLELWQDGKLIESFSVGLGRKPVGKKEKEGDGKTPEGEYYVCTRNQNSKFYLSLGISYPNIEDAKNGLENGLINEEIYQSIVNANEKGECPSWYTPLGGEIMIHGHGGSSDWTLGCIAVDDEVMDILWEVCEIGTKVVIYP